MTEQTGQNALAIVADEATARLVKDVLAARGASVVIVGDTSSAAVQIELRRWDLAIADLSAEGDAVALLRKIRDTVPELPVVALVDGKVPEPVRRTCTNLLSKPVDRKELASLLDVLLPAHAVDVAACVVDGDGNSYRLIGRSEKFMRALMLAKKVAPTSAPVLVTGESGTGKELISYFVHGLSNRSEGPFIHVNCSALSESLLESELFGHEKGAFTGASKHREGRFERADGGTLLLDEISETTPKFQAELLRVMEQQTFERVGGSDTIRVNVRVISTSNRNLIEEVERGRLRRDLYYRISGVCLFLPPLRERIEDIRTLVWHFVNLYAPEVHRRVAKLDERMMSLLEQYAWPGNVRQLRNLIRGVLILGDGPVLSLDDAPFLLEEIQLTARADASTLHLRELERQAILEALRRTKQNQIKAARMLGITDRTLREKLRKYREADELQATGERKW